MTRTEKLELLLTMSQRVDSYTTQLRFNKRMYNECARLEINTLPYIYNIKKYKRVISIIEIRWLNAILRSLGNIALANNTQGT